MSLSPLRYFALVPCAGAGQRAGCAVPKQYVGLAGQALVAHTLASLAAVRRLTTIVVVLSPQDQAFETHVPHFTGVKTRTGGSTRAASVRAGLAVLRQTCGAGDLDWVLVHDAARCLLRPEIVDRLIDACRGDAVGGLLAMPLSDTLKQADGHDRVLSTLDRQGKWTAQTPQMFRLGDLERGLMQVDERITDEASAIESLGLRPRLVRGEADNWKVTWPEDFGLAAQVLHQRLSSGASEQLDFLSVLQSLERTMVDPDAYNQHNWETWLSPDFFEIGSHGVVHNRDQVLNWLRQPERPRYVLENFTLQDLGHSLIQLSYLARRVESERSGGVIQPTWRTSLWQHDLVGGWWRLRSHQSTPVQQPRV